MAVLCLERDLLVSNVGSPFGGKKSIEVQDRVMLLYNSSMLANLVP